MSRWWPAVARSPDQAPMTSDCRRERDSRAPSIRCTRPVSPALPPAGPRCGSSPPLQPERPRMHRPRPSAVSTSSSCWSRSRQDCAGACLCLRDGRPRHHVAGVRSRRQMRIAGVIAGGIGLHRALDLRLRRRGNRLRNHQRRRHRCHHADGDHCTTAPGHHMHICKYDSSCCPGRAGSLLIACESLERGRQRPTRRLIRRPDPVQPVVGERGRHDLQAHRQPVVGR